MLLEIDNISKTYSANGLQVQALDGISISVGAGEFVAVQGPSGCGKTTLLLVAGGLLAPNSGRILVDGQEPYSLSANSRALFRGATIGFVFQQFHLVPYLNVLENILAASIAGGSKDPKDRALELIARFHLEPRMHHTPAQLSTGERQRTALARALLNQPKILLADEPTGNLDRKNAEVVLDYLQEFADDGGGILLVTHDEDAVKHAQRITRIFNGKLEIS